MTPTQDTEIDFLLRVAKNTKEPASTRLDAVHAISLSLYNVVWIYVAPTPEQVSRAADLREKKRELATVVLEIRTDECAPIADRVRASDMLLAWGIGALAPIEATE